MTAAAAIDAFAALAQRTRLAVFRLLVQTGPAGLAAGAIAAELQVPANTLSAHLNVLKQAGLLRVRRESRSLIYSVNFVTVRGLLRFLLQDCCRGRAEVCMPLIDAVFDVDSPSPLQRNPS